MDQKCECGHDAEEHLKPELLGGRRECGECECRNLVPKNVRSEPEADR